MVTSGVLEDNKVKRYFNEKDRIVREYRKYVYRYYGGNFDEVAVKGYFRKRKAGSCKNSKCLVCHYEKVLRIKSVNGKIAYDRFKESLDDFYDISDAPDNY